MYDFFLLHLNGKFAWTEHTTWSHSWLDFLLRLRHLCGCHSNKKTLSEWRAGLSERFHELRTPLFVFA